MIRLLVALLLSVFLSSAAMAGATADCANPKLSPKRITWACTVVIEHNPKAASAYDVARRGLAHSLNGDDGLALKDYDEALKYDGIGNDVAIHRRFALYNLGRDKEAAKALVKMANFEGDISTQLLRLRALQRAGLHLDPGLNFLIPVRDDWYKPLVELHVSDGRVAAVLAAAAKEPARNQCIMHFFIGEWHVHQAATRPSDAQPPNAVAEAKTQFQRAIDICPPTAIERSAAKAALKKL